MKKLIFSLLILPNLILGQVLHQEERVYEYNNLNHIANVVFSNGTIYEYAYDNLGNRIARNVSQPELTYVPDDAFEQKLIDLGYDDVIDDYVLTANINSINILDVTNLDINDATGIQDFISLETLLFGGNNLSEINLSSNNLLKNLTISANQLTSLNLTENILLESVFCELNLLEDLDLNNNINLKYLSCYTNNLVNLNLSNNLLIESLYCGGTNITSLDLSNHQNLRQFESLNGNLYYLNVNNGNNESISYFYTINNPNLFCIQVDDEIAANNGTGVYANWMVDAQVEYSEDCEFLQVDDNELQYISLYPNPTENTLFLSLSNYIGSNLNYVLFDINGRLLKEESTFVENQPLDIDVSSLASGSYIIKVTIEGKNWTSNFIKE